MLAETSERQASYYYRFCHRFCILFTANDAYMRDDEVMVPADCVAAETAAANTRILKHMRRFLKADIRHSARLRL